MMRALLAAALLLPMAPSAAAAATVKATPETIATVIAAATDGTTIEATGTFGVVTIANRTFSPPLVLRGGSFTGIILLRADGVTLSGTTITGSTVKDSYGIWARRSSNIRIENAHIGGAHRGIVFAQVSDFAIVKSRFDGLGSDGIDIALSRRGLIADNVMLNFNPKPATYAEGKIVKDGDHPDGIQMWSRPPDLPVADITITGNSITGQVQCIFGGNRIRNGADDGGYDRIIIEHNTCRNGLGRGITLASARGSRIRFNDAAALPGATLLKTGQRIKTQIMIRPDDPTSIACGNKVPDVPNSPAARPCPRDATASSR